MPDALHHRRFGRLRPEALGIGTLFVFLSVVHLWTALVGFGYARLSSLAPALPEAPILVGTFVTAVLGYGLPTVVYVHLRDLDVPIGRPDGDAGRGLLVAVGVPIGLVAGVALVGHVLVGTSVAAINQTYYSPDVGLPFLVRTTVLPAAFGALGTGALLFGVVQTRLRDLTTPRVAVGLTTVVAGVFYFLPTANLSPGRVDGVALALFGASVLVGVCVGMALGLAYRGIARDDLDGVVSVTYAPILILGGLGALAIVQTTLVDLPGAVTDLALLGAVAAGAYGYDRTRSLWTPVASVFVYRAALGVAVYLEVIYGFAPVP